MDFKKSILRRMYTPTTYTEKKYQNTHGYICIVENQKQWKWIANQSMKPITKTYPMIKLYIGQRVNISVMEQYHICSTIGI